MIKRNGIKIYDFYEWTIKKSHPKPNLYNKETKKILEIFYDNDNDILYIKGLGKDKIETDGGLHDWQDWEWFFDVCRRSFDYYQIETPNFFQKWDMGWNWSDKKFKIEVS